MRRIRLTAATTLLLILTLAGCDRGQKPRSLGKAAPAFTLHDGAQTVSLDQYRGKVVLINFWASWCAPCVEEIPSLLALHRQIPQLAILGISIDENPQAYDRFLAQYAVSFPTVRDPSQAVMHRYGTAQIPESYLIDRSGHIARKYISEQDWTRPEIVDTIQMLLKEK